MNKFVENERLNNYNMYNPRHKWYEQFLEVCW